MTIAVRRLLLGLAAAILLPMAAGTEAVATQDRTEGKPITPDLFAKSKAIYLMRNEPVDIVGFYSERHSGIFISDLAPGLEGTDVKNALHAHMISRDGKAAGHIDDIVLAGGMTLRLPTN